MSEVVITETPNSEIKKQNSIFELMMRLLIESDYHASETNFNLNPELIEKPLSPSRDPEYVKQYNRKKYLQQREARVADALSRIFCPHCNCDYAKGRQSKHFKTIKHLKNIKNSEAINQI